MPYVGHLGLDQIHNGTLKPFVNAKKSEGRKNKTINHSLAIVRRIVNLAARDWRDEEGLTWLHTAPMITFQTDRSKTAKADHVGRATQVASLP